jgi:hypothetical protein
MAPDAALRLAGDDVRKQYTNINGFMVKTGDRAIESYGALLNAAGLQPRSFDESVRKYLEQYAKDNPAAPDMQAPDFVTRMLFPPESGVTPPGVPGRTLSIRPVTDATGAWAVIDAATGLPVPSGPNGMRQVIGLRDLLEFERRTQGEEQTREAARLAAAAKANPPQPTPTIDIANPPYRLPKIRLPFGWAGSEEAPEE